MRLLIRRAPWWHSRAGQGRWPSSTMACRLAAHAAQKTHSPRTAHARRATSLSEEEEEGSEVEP